MGQAEPGLKWWQQHLVPLHVSSPGFVLSVAVEQLPTWRVPHLLVPSCLLLPAETGASLFCPNADAIIRSGSQAARVARPQPITPCSKSLALLP